MAHSIRRIGERYREFRHVPLSEFEYLEAVKSIQQCKPGYSLIHSEKDGVQSVWRCFIRGEQVYATYCRERRCITTFLPPGSFRPKKRYTKEGKQAPVKGARFA